MVIRAALPGHPAAHPGPASPEAEPLFTLRTSSANYTDTDVAVGRNCDRRGLLHKIPRDKSGSRLDLKRSRRPCLRFAYAHKFIRFEEKNRILHDSGTDVGVLKTNLPAFIFWIFTLGGYANSHFYRIFI